MPSDDERKQPVDSGFSNSGYTRIDVPVVAGENDINGPEAPRACFGPVGTMIPFSANVILSTGGLLLGISNLVKPGTPHDIVGEDALAWCLIFASLKTLGSGLHALSTSGANKCKNTLVGLGIPALAGGLFALGTDMVRRHILPNSADPGIQNANNNAGLYAAAGAAVGAAAGLVVDAKSTARAIGNRNSRC